MKPNCLLLLFLTFFLACKQPKQAFDENNYTMDLRYAPSINQTAINLPDEVQKTIVNGKGQIFYDYMNNPVNGKWLHGPFNDCNISIGAGLDSIESGSLSQQLFSPKIPIVITRYTKKSLAVTIENFAVAPALKKDMSDSCEVSKGFFGLPHNDFITLHIKNDGSKDTAFTARFIVNSTYNTNTQKNSIRFDDRIEVQFPEGCNIRKKTIDKGFEFIAELPLQLRAGADTMIVASISIGKKAELVKADKSTALSYRNGAIQFWNEYPIPYECINVPDSNIQGLAESCIRNIYQAREIKNGLPVFQVGPTCYRGLWIVDGSFLLESMTFLGQIKDVRNGIEYMLGFQRPNGSFELIEKHWKETGIVLWAVTRHAKLTGDKKWLESKWDNIRRGVAYIDTMRYLTMKDKNAINYGLIPEGFSDGGLGRKTLEYTNVYWTLNGLKAASEAAVWLKKDSEAKLWKAKFDTMFATYEKAATKSLKADSCGNKAVPIYMTDKCQLQRAQWAFCHAVHPGKLFSNDDSLMLGTMNMLKCNEREGLVYETGWQNKGIWNYFGSFYAHAWLWLGDGPKATQTMYAMANHASSTLLWREEHPVKTYKTDTMTGDMPHNWASAEFIRMIRNFIILERGNDLHLFEALPPTWTKPGMRTELKDIYTEFGIMNVSLVISQDGKSAEVNADLNSENHDKPSQVFIHQDVLNGKDPFALKPEFPIHQTIKL